MTICWAFACTFIPGDRAIQARRTSNGANVPHGTTREIVRYFEAINTHQTSGRNSEPPAILEARMFCALAIARSISSIGVVDFCHAPGITPAGRSSAAESANRCNHRQCRIRRYKTECLRQRHCPLRRAGHGCFFDRNISEVWPAVRKIRRL
jgi:hypothetical protein